MYLKYYNLKKEPFNVTPNLECVFPNPSHKKALARIIYGVEPPTGEGYSKPEMETEAEASTQKLTAKFEEDGSTYARNTFLVKRIDKKGEILCSRFKKSRGHFIRNCPEN